MSHNKELKFTCFDCQKEKVYSDLIFLRVPEDKSKEIERFCRDCRKGK